jgi:hypothetical protein
MRKLISALIAVIGFCIVGAGMAFAQDVGGSAFTDWLNTFALNHAWVGFVVLGILAVSKILTMVRDAIDTTPATDDNWFERTCTILKKVGAALAGFRPKTNP